MITIKSLFSFIALTAALEMSAQEPVTMKLWPNGPAKSNGLKESFRSEGIVFLENSSEALLYVYSPAKDKNTGKAVIICPGGAYMGLAMDHEGHLVAKWLASEGITGIVLKYRVPNGQADIPFADAEEAVKMIRKKSISLFIDPHKIGIAGFSAGGHLAATIATNRMDSLSRPDFAVLFYPVISSDTRYGHAMSFEKLSGTSDTAKWQQYSNDRRVSAHTPPTLLFHSDDDDAVSPMNSILFYEALKKYNVPASIYIFPSGGHGWGFNPKFRYNELWKTLLLDWLLLQ